MVCMLFMVSIVMLYVGYLHSMIYKHLLPLYGVSYSGCPREFPLYPMDLMMSGLWCFGLL
jgi:hypothetical protein